MNKLFNRENLTMLLIGVVVGYVIASFLIAYVWR